MNEDFTLKDGTTRKIKIEEGMIFERELKKEGVSESDMFQMQLVEQDNKL